jgi:hypothetical protein
MRRYSKLVNQPTISTRSTPILMVYIKLLTSLLKSFIGSEEIVYKQKQEVGMSGFCVYP